MVYKDYLKAARKHEITCEIIAEKLNEEKQRKDKKHRGHVVKSLTLTLYYLSGYIIECMVKYAIYDLNGYGSKDDVKDLNEKGLTYHTHIRFHPFKRYTEHLNNLMSGTIPLINDEKNIPEETVRIYKEWDATIRYSYEMKYDEIHYIRFYEYAKEIFKIIKDNTKG
ncbi:hypothetical protein [Desulfonema magnum]|uniref:Uncharacterized protein n=1 Tax=Desulfonema magnum TaxID=45655 RepID=A0A975BTB9_9BACT|nr:hypothetical protein [Desulfonema magnum]QTA91038.1 Uncharacterized protein dnm_071040 [Desulfonema magnum]